MKNIDVDFTIEGTTVENDALNRLIKVLIEQLVALLRYRWCGIFTDVDGEHRRKRLTWSRDHRPGHVTTDLIM